jgi:hypothetical protein
LDDDNSNKIYAQRHVYTWETRQDKTHYQYFTLEGTEIGMSSI